MLHSDMMYCLLLTRRYKIPQVFRSLIHVNDHSFRFMRIGRRIAVSCVCVWYEHVHNFSHMRQLAFVMNGAVNVGIAFALLINEIYPCLVCRIESRLLDTIRKPEQERIKCMTARSPKIGALFVTQKPYL